MSTRWLTRADIKKDLAATTGLYDVEKDIDFVVGSKPPPSYQEEDIGDEIKYIHGNKKISKYGAPNETYGQPDLKGIANMLKMVKGADEESDEEITDVDKNQRYCLTKSSHLNPNVKEFVPKTGEPAKQPETDNEKSPARDAVEEKVKQLKETIRNTEGTSLKQKRERNVAMSTLLRLHTRAASTTNETVSRATSATSELIGVLKVAVADCEPNGASKVPCADNELNVVAKVGLAETNLKAEPVIATTSSNINTSPKPPVLRTPEYFESTSVENTKDEEARLAKHMSESAAKVTEWLTPKVTEPPPPPPPKPKPTLLTQPFKFKRKEVSKSKSPSEAAETKIPKTSASCTSFVPSSYANTLEQEYLQRQEKATVAEIENTGEVGNNDLWSCIERELVAKERQKAKNKKHAGGSNDTD